LLTALLALYWSAAARRRERWLLRVIGASRGELIFISWLEGTITLLAGAVLGGLLGRAGASAAFAALGGATAIDPSTPLTIQEMAAPIILTAAGSLGGIFAAWRDGFGGDEW
jgi:ABC-type antimicrobial peptide transport system permease subunit